MLSNILVNNLKKGNWKTKHTPNFISGCEKLSTVSEVSKFVREGSNYIAYDQNDKIIMFNIQVVG